MTSSPFVRGIVVGSLATFAVDAKVAVGEEVAGTLIDVELDPGSGAWWSLWESLADR